MHLKIITHDRIVFDEDVNEIYTKGVDGEFGILKGHIPVVSALDIGLLKLYRMIFANSLQQWVEYSSSKMMKLPF